MPTVDTTALLATLRPALDALHKDLTVRALDPGVRDALEAEWTNEKSARRTADPFAVWVDERVGQVAAAWVLSVLFVRTLEDRGLCPPRLKGGRDAHDAFRRLFPYLTDRDYLRAVFRGLSGKASVAHVFDPAHNPVWLLGPSAEAAAALVDLSRDPAHGLAAFDLSGDTRFLGDVYQDLNEHVRKRYALCQTPDFVEDYLLKHTLDPALETRGADVTVCDPTCGSGHLLLGAFQRILTARRRTEPTEVAAYKAIHQVYGADLNPYALAIARIRLVLAYLDAICARSLREGRDLRLNVVVSDSLLPPAGDAQQQLGASGPQQDLWNVNPHGLRQDDEARRVFAKPFDVVVGNPPYITPKDEVLRDEYRKRYVSAYREYQLVVPFVERFFQLTNAGGWVAAIVGNGFMKREFGSKLIEAFLPQQDLTAIVDTSGAYIPGHGTPTVILFGRHQPPTTPSVRCVMGKRGEPTTPADPAAGLVWSSIRDHGHQVGFENEFVSVEEVEREKLGQHPWSLRGGGAGGLKSLLEGRATQRLHDVITECGFGAVTREDDVFIVGAGAVERLGVDAQHRRPFVAGEDVRDWAIGEASVAVWPYDASTHDPLDELAAADIAKALWPWRSRLASRTAYGQTQIERGLPWFAYSMYFAKRFVTPLTITFAFVATHNHFVLDRGGKVFKQSAPIIKLPADATEDDHFALLGYLNSSTACFWMKQVFHPKSSASQRHHPDPARYAYEFASTGLLPLPLPDPTERRAILARALDAAAAARAEATSVPALAAAIEAVTSPDDLRAYLAERWRRADQFRERAVFLQEELDWLAYTSFGLAPAETLTPEYLASTATLPRGQRAFEQVDGWTSVVRADHELVPVEVAEAAPVSAFDERLRPTRSARIRALEAAPQLRLIETNVYKRLWRDTERNEPESVHRARVDREQLTTWLLDHVEALVRRRTSGTSLRELASQLQSHPGVMVVAQVVSGEEEPDLVTVLTDLVTAESVPFLAAHTFKPSGLVKLGEWEKTWDAQRREDAGEATDVPLPPEYESSDFKQASYWKLRGKLDVPKERFILYPDAHTDDDPSLVVGWAGWNHAQRLDALYALHKRLAGHRDAAALVPLLAGMHELLPWVQQWHGKEDPYGLGQGLGEVWEARLARLRQEAGVTVEELRGWRPVGRRGKR